MTLPPARIRVVSAPPEHVGPGSRNSALPGGRPSGLSCSPAEADLTVDELARWTGRGRRSGIGLHGFQHGGLIVDGGRQK